MANGRLRLVYRGWASLRVDFLLNPMKCCNYDKKRFPLRDREAKPLESLETCSQILILCSTFLEVTEPDFGDETKSSSLQDKKPET